MAALAAIEWDNVNIAGAFVIGSVLGALAAIRIFRVIAGTVRTERRKDDAPD